MCWSEEASFSSGVALVGAGFITIRHAKKNDMSAIFFSLFPVLFGIHQIIEGLIWHYLSTGKDLRILPYAYVSIAVLFWPVAVPVASIHAEKYKNIRQILFIPALTGIFVAFYSGLKLWHANGVDVLLIGHSLSYTIDFESKIGIFVEYLYVFSVVMPLIFNTRKMVNVFGLSVLVAFAISSTLLRDVYVSVWCLMCAWLSLIIYFIVETQPANQGHYRKKPRYFACTLPVEHQEQGES